MSKNFESYLKQIKAAAPAICSRDDLIKHFPQFFGSKSTIYRMMIKGELPPQLMVNGHSFFLVDDVIDYLRDRYIKDINA